MRLIVTLYYISICALSFSQNDKILDWKNDLNYLKSELPKRHVNFYSIKTEDYFFSGLEKISNQQDKLTDFETAIKLQQLLANFGDSHTGIVWQQYIDYEKTLPLILHWFKDGIYILFTNRENSTLLGHKLTHINGVNINQVIDSLSTLLTVDNYSYLKSNIPKLIPIVQLHEYFGFVNSNSITLQLENMDGSSMTYEIEPALLNKERVMCEIDSLALCYRNKKKLFIDYYIEEDNIYYIQYNDCWSRELELKYSNEKKANALPSFQNFKDSVLQNIKEMNIDKIVFDIRFNSGGSSHQGREFIEELSQIEKIKTEGKLFVILGYSTFSAAIQNAMDFKSMTNAIFVGEEPGGKPNHYGAVKRFNLPSSKLIVTYSTEFFKIIDDKQNALIPENIIETSFKDFKKGIDPVYEWIKTQ